MPQMMPLYWMLILFLSVILLTFLMSLLSETFMSNNKVVVLTHFSSKVDAMKSFLK